ncbi:MAG TPA: DNA primase DnaG [Candidatus Nanoarchaeia archaeon]|nr:DNA primase DnaG [Candidatus Nanoarchaeia archaeon]
MGKISPVSSKYIVHSTIDIEGVVDRPDVIGAIFGQTEGLLGSDLELRELQRSGRIGRIEVNVEIRNGKSTGSIIIPSSLDKAETSIVAAALEVIQRIGPCNAKVRVQSIEDVRISKRTFVIERAKELLKNLMENVMPDSQELADEVAYSVRVMEIQEYGSDRLPSGPSIDDSDEIIVVEGRADVLNLLKHGIKNAIALNGTSIPPTIGELSKKKVITAFVDGDRGGKLIIKELLGVAEIDFVAFAPDGKEVEEITNKEIHKAIRSRISAEQAKLELGRETEAQERRDDPRHMQSRPQFSIRKPKFVKRPTGIGDEQRVKFKEILEGLVGTHGAQVLDSKLSILGKVPISELPTTIKSLSSGIYAIVFDGSIDKDLVQKAEMSSVKFLVAMDSQVKAADTSVGILTLADLADVKSQLN